MCVCVIGALLCEYIRNWKSIPACAQGHFYNTYGGVCVSLRVFCPRMSACAHVCACVQYWSAGLRPVCMCLCVYVCVYVFQESQWLDSVSLLIKDTLEGEMLMIDNLSGSVFHHYSSPPPICKDCKGHPQEVPPWTHVRTHMCNIHTHIPDKVLYSTMDRCIH